MTENHAFEDVDIPKPSTIMLSKNSPLYQGSLIYDQNQVVIPPPPPGIKANEYQRMSQDGAQIVFESTVDSDVNNNFKVPVTSQITGFFRRTFKSKKNSLL